MVQELHWVVEVAQKEELDWLKTEVEVALGLQTMVVEELAEDLYWIFSRLVAAEVACQWIVTKMRTASMLVLGGLS